MKKNWLGSGTGTGGTKPKDRSRERDRSKRFALIERGRDKKEDESSGLKEADIMKLVSGTKDLLHGLLALQLAQNLSRSQKKKKTKKNRHHRSTSSSASGSTSESSSSSSETGSCSRTRGRAKAISDLQATKRKMFRRPLKYMKRYVRSIERELGAQDKPFRIVDYTPRISFGKQRNLQRCHHLFGIVLEFLLKEQYEKAALQTTLCLQALHQAAIDSVWTTAWLLTHTPDPYEKRPESLD